MEDLSETTERIRNEVKGKLPGDQNILELE